MPLKALRTMLASGVIAAMLAVAPAQAAGCAEAAHAGGDWTSVGGTLQGTRSQPNETTIGTDNVSFLSPEWSFRALAGNIQTAPVVAAGCVYVGTTNGDVVALNADTGEQVWLTHVRDNASLWGPAVHDGVVYVNVPARVSETSEKGPHTVALDAATGVILWIGENVADDTSTGSSAIYFEDLVIVGLTNSENTYGRQGGYGLVDATDGTLIKRVHTISDEQAALGFGGCSVWSQWAIDPQTKHGYVGTGQPAGWLDQESEMCNALIKVDLDRTRDTFGEIVGVRKGTWDEPPYLDVDFGSAATLLNDSYGRQLVVSLQKAGWLHAAHTRHMTAAWSTPVSPFGTALGNFTGNATDGTNVFTVGAFAGYMWSINGTTGLPNWMVPVTSPVATNSVAYANGVVYYTNELGILQAFDSTTGLPLLARPLALDQEGCVRAQSSSVSIARNTVYAACGPVIVAYQA